ncbi:MAG: hypothetical protein RL767_1389, partial [Bacteroidota bacterium]
LLNFAVYDSTCTTQLYRVLKVNLVGEREASALKLSALPNPIQDALRVDGLQPGIRIQITSAVGQLVEDRITEQSNQLFDTQFWPSGIYLIQAEGYPSVKVVKP